MDRTEELSEFVGYDLLESRIQSQYESLPKRLKLLAAFTIAHPEDMALSTLAELADAAGSHPSTFVRLSKQLGFSGFSEMQAVYRRNLRGTLQNYRGRLDAVQPNADESVLDTVIETAGASLRRLQDTINADNWQNMVDELSGAETIWLAAAGRSGVILDYAQYLMTNMGIVCRRFSPYDRMASLEIALTGQKDRLLAMSFRPYSEDIISLVRQADTYGLPTLAITDTKLSPLFTKTSLQIEEADYAGFRSMSAVMAVIQALVIEIGKHRETNR